MLFNSRYKCLVIVFRGIVRELHGETCLCIVQIGIEQRYGESPDT